MTQAQEIINVLSRIGASNCGLIAGEIRGMNRKDVESKITQLVRAGYVTKTSIKGSTNINQRKANIYTLAPNTLHEIEQLKLI